MVDLQQAPSPGETTALARLAVPASGPAPAAVVDPAAEAVQAAVIDEAARGSVASVGAAAGPAGPGVARSGRQILPAGARGMAALLALQRTAGNRAATAIALRSRPPAPAAGPSAPGETGLLTVGGAPVVQEDAEDDGVLHGMVLPGEQAPVGAAGTPDDMGAAHGARRRDIQRLASHEIVVQRTPDSKEVRDEGLVRALAMLNSNGAVKLVWKAAPKGPLADGVIEVKSYAVDVEGTAAFTAPGLTASKSPASSGTTRTRTAEGDKAAEWANVFAAEIKGKADPVLPTALAGKVDYKLTGAQYTPEKSLTSSFGVGIDGQYVSGTVTFNIIQADPQTKSLKPMTATIKLTTGQFLQTSLPGLVTVGGYAVDVKLRVKVSGSVIVGANWEQLAAALGRAYGPDTASALLKENVGQIAKEDAEKTLSELSREMAEEACRDIPDDVTREAAMARAEQAAREEATKRGLPEKLSELELQSLQGAEDLATARAQMQAKAKAAARQQMADFREPLGRRIVEELKALGRGDILPEFLKKRVSSKEAELVQEATKLATEAFDAQVRELAEEATKRIADPKLREEAVSAAERHITVELESRGLRTEAIVQAERAAKSAALRSAIKDAAVDALKVAVGKFRTEIIEGAIKGIASFSLKTAATKLALELAGGPADLVLNGVDAIAGWIDTIVKDQEIKVAGLTAVRMKDNFVRAYSTALMGPVAGAGQKGGGDNPEGQAYLAGAQAGRQNYAEIIKRYVNPPVGQDELEKLLKEQAISVDASKINALASGKVKEIMYSAYAREHRGWFEDEADVLKSQDFQNFKEVVESNLDKNGRITWARLANGVTVKLIALDSTGDRAQVFRTVDGRYSGVTIHGEKQTHSGWITAEGVPLEDVFPAQGDAEVANVGDQDRTQRMAQQLRASTIQVSATLLLLPAPKVASAAVLGPSRDDPAFMDFLHDPEALGQTLASCGAKIVVMGALPGSGSYSMNVVGGDVRVDYASRVDFLAHPDAAGYVQSAGIDSRSADAVSAYVLSTWASFFAGRTLASLPKLG